MTLMSNSLTKDQITRQVERVKKTGKALTVRMKDTRDMRVVYHYLTPHGWQGISRFVVWELEPFGLINYVR